MNDTNAMYLFSASAQRAMAAHVERLVMEAVTEISSEPTADGVRIKVETVYDLAHLEAMKESLRLLGGGHVVCVKVPALVAEAERKKT